jgi:hypothetical protein
MKKRIVLPLLSMAFFALDASAKLSSPDEIQYAGNLAYKNFCEAVVKDDVNMLKRSVRDKVGILANNDKDVLRKLTAADGMECNGVDLVLFSEQRKASQVYKYLSNAK